MTNKKLITVIKEQRCLYSVEGKCDNQEAMALVRQRLEAGAPIGLEKEEDPRVIRFELEDEAGHREVYDADGNLAKEA